MVTRGTRGGVPELSASGDRGRQDVGLVGIRRPLHRRCEVRRARHGQHGRPRKHPRVDRFHDEHLSRQRDAGVPGGVVLDRHRQGLGHLQERQHDEGSWRRQRPWGPVITVLEYAGDDKWSYEEDAYNPMNVLVMVRAYIQRCHELGTISDDARTFAENMNWELT